MPPGISAVTALSPIIASQFVFSSRRASRGVEELDSNPLVALMNFDIALAQFIKGTNAALDTARATSMELASAVNEVDGALKNIKNSSKFLKGAGHVIDFTAKHINPVICVTGAVKALNSEDKIEALADEIIKLGTMFTFEGAYKRLTGMPRYGKENGAHVLDDTCEALYKKIGFLDNAVENFTKHCGKTKFLKFLPGTLKGLGFAVASICGYKLGSTISHKGLGLNQSQKVEAKQ